MRLAALVIALTATSCSAEGQVDCTWKPTEFLEAREWWKSLGPTVPGLGIRKGGEVTQAQVAATIAAFLGEDFLKAQPKAARPIDWR